MPGDTSSRDAGAPQNRSDRPRRRRPSRRRRPPYDRPAKETIPSSKRGAVEAAPTKGWYHTYTARLLLMVGIGVGILLFCYYLRSVFTPFLVGFLLAYMLNPVINWGERYLRNRAYCIALFCGLFVIMLLCGIGILVPLVYHEVQNLPAAVFGDAFEDSNGNGHWDAGEALTTDWDDDGKYDAGYLDEVYEGSLKLVRAWAARTQRRSESTAAAEEGGQPKKKTTSLPAPKKTPSSDVDAAELHDVIEQMRQWIEANYVQVVHAGGKVSSWVAHKLATVLRGLLNLFNLFSALILVPVYAIFLLYSMNDIRDAVFTHLPSRYRDRIISVLTQIHLSVSAFFRGRLIICSILGVMTAIFLSLCGVRFAIVMGLVAGVGSLIPFLGVLIPMFIAILFVYLDYESVWRVLAVIGSFAFVQTVEGWVLTPLILGREVELHPVTLILSLFIFGEMFGLFGVLMAVPLACIIKILGKEFVLPQLNALAEDQSRGQREPA